MFTIRQTAEGWELVGADGVVLATVEGAGGYDALLGELSARLSAERATLAMDGGGDDGLLPEEWLAEPAWLSEPTGDGRDFSETEWTWRDPDACLIPLMLHTETEVGHFGAQLAGFATAISLDAARAGVMRGRFYDNEQGVAFRDMLLGGRRYGVSVDPGAVAVEYRCVSVDDDGWCTEEELVFLAYEVIGLTGTPFPGFAGAHIVLAGGAAEAPTTPAEGEEEPAAAASAPSRELAAVGAAVAEGLVEGLASHASAQPAAEACCDSCAQAAAARAPRRSGMIAAAAPPARPPASWFADPQFDRLTALRIEEDGRVYGHLAPWGQCHIGYQGECVVTPRSLANYAYFRTGYLVCEGGEEVAVGQLSVGGGHADQSLSFRGAVEHYDSVAHAFADVASGEDAWGVWVAGALRPGVNETMLRAVRASPPSGDWREIGAGLELVAACSVTSQGFPIARVASGGRVLSLVAAGAPVMRALAANPTDERLDRLERQLAALRADATGPARARLRAAGRERARERLLAHR